MDDDSEIDFGGIIINIIFIPFFIFLFSALFGNLILYRLYTKFVEYIFYQLGLSEGAGSIFALLWALLPGVLLALFLFGFLMYFLNKIIGDSIILRLLVAIFTFGMLEGFLEIDFFNFGEGSGEHAIATEDTSGIDLS